MFCTWSLPPTNWLKHEELLAIVLSLNITSFVPFFTKMHFSIPDTQVNKDSSGSYVVCIFFYKIIQILLLNGFFVTTDLQHLYQRIIPLLTSLPATLSIPFAGIFDYQYLKRLQFKYLHFTISSRKHSVHIHFAIFLRKSFSRFHHLNLRSDVLTLKNIFKLVILATL